MLQDSRTFPCSSTRFTDLKAHIYAAETDYELLETGDFKGELLLKKFGIVLGFEMGFEVLLVWIKNKPKFITEALVWRRVEEIFR